MLTRVTRQIPVKWRTAIGVTSLLLVIWKAGAPALAPAARFVAPLPGAAPRSGFAWIDDKSVLYQGLDNSGQPEFRRLEVDTGVVATFPKVSPALAVLQMSGARAWRANPNGSVLAVWPMFAAGSAVLAKPDGTVLAIMSGPLERVRDVCWQPLTNRVLILIEGNNSTYLDTFDVTTFTHLPRTVLSGKPERVICTGASTAFVVDRANDTPVISGRTVEIGPTASPVTKLGLELTMNMGTANGFWMMEPSPRGDRVAIAGFLPEKPYWADRVLEQFNLGSSRRRFRVEIWMADGRLRSAKRIAVLYDLRMRSRLRWRLDGKALSFVRDGSIWEIPFDLSKTS